MTQVSNTAKLAAVAATLAAVMLAYSAVIAPATAQTAPSTPTTSTGTAIASNAPAGFSSGLGKMAPMNGGAPMRGAFGRGGGNFQQSLPSLTVGQTITVTSTQGKYVLAGDRTKNGTASGTLTFTVTGKLTGGYTLSITKGSLVVNGTTYNVSSGSAQMGRGAASLVGQGATTPSGQFLVSASARGNFAGTASTVSIDLSAGSTEYLVFLAGTISS